MPLELLERDQVLATVMPGHPGGQPVEPGGGETPDAGSDDDDEPEGDPS